jgi:hypothetical protein
MCQLFLNYCKCVTKTITLLQPMYNVHAYDHAMCPHLHHPLRDTFATSFFIMTHIDTISMAIGAPLLKYYCLIML